MVSRNLKRQRRWARLLSAGVVAFGIALSTACSGAGSGQDSGPVDDAFLADLVSGWVERWDYFDQPEQELSGDDPKYAEKEKEQFTTAVNIEIEKLGPYADGTFEDKDLQVRATDYIALLHESLESLKFMNVDDLKYIDTWNDVYDRRSIAILDFIDTYKLEIPESHSDIVTEIRTNAELAVSKADTEEKLSKTFCTLEWQLLPDADEYDTFFDYTTTVVNPLEIDFANVFLEVSIVDENGVNLGTEYTSVSNWRAGQPAIFDLPYLKSPIASYDISANWEDVDGNYGSLTALC